MLNDKIIGFIYRIDYIGNNEKIKDISYAGSKKITSKIKWDKYFGSPSKKECEKTLEWKMETKRNPKNFKKTIIKYVYEGDSLIQNEINYLKSVSKDIKKDDKWLNFSIPRIGAFPECKFTQEERIQITEKRKRTLLEKTGKEYGEFLNIDKRRATCLKTYGVDHPNKTKEAKIKNSIHKKEYFSKMTPEERKLHGEKVIKGQTPEGTKLGVLKTSFTKSQFTEEKKKEIQDKRKKSWRNAVDNRSEEKQNKFIEHNKYISRYCTKRLYVTLKILEDDTIKSDFICNWKENGFGRSGISNAIKNKLTRPVYCRNVKKHVLVLNAIRISKNDLIILNSEKQ